MTKQQLLKELLEQRKKSLNKNSKWYSQDIADYKENISKLSVKDLESRLEMFNAFSDPKSQFNKMANAEMKLMNKGGMYNIGNMKPTNCLD